MTVEEEFDELQKEIQERYENMKEGEWMCVLCEEVFKGTPKYFQDTNEPLCANCFEESKKLPPYTIEINGKLHVVYEKK